MKLRMKLASVASALVLAASLGVVFAGPAAATTDIRLCITSDECATAFPRSLSQVVTASQDNSIAWNATKPGNTGEIFVYPASNNLCMRLYFGGSNLVKLYPCQGLASEEWFAEGGATLHTEVFQNQYQPQLCLTAIHIPSEDTNYVYAGSCAPLLNNKNQEWTGPS